MVLGLLGRTGDRSSGGAIRYNAVVRRRSDAFFDAVALSLVAAFAFGLRTIVPWSRVFRDDAVAFQGNDAWHHMRLIDHLVAHFPDAMTHDPYLLYAQQMDFSRVPGAPGFDFLVAGIAWMIGAGDPSPRLVESVAAVLPPLLGTLCLPVAYCLARLVYGRVAGLAAAAVLAIVPGPFLDRTFLGWADHHAAEALLGSLALVSMVSAVEKVGSSSEPGDVGARRRRIALALFAGVCLGCYLLTWAFGYVLVLIAAAWALVHVADDTGPTRSSADVVLVVLTAFVVAGVIVSVGPSLLRPYPQAGGPLVLFGAAALVFGSGVLVRGVRGRRFGRLAVIVVSAGTAALAWRLGGGWSEILRTGFSRLAVSETALTVSEVRPFIDWGDPFSQDAGIRYVLWLTLIAMASVVALGARVFRERDRPATLLLVWTVAVAFLTLSRGRFGYYLAFNLAVLAGGAVAAVLGFATRLGRQREWERPLRAAALVAILAVLYWPLLRVSMAAPGIDMGPPAAWREALAELRRTTPPPFAEGDLYLSTYEPEAFPQPTYGVLSWWDYGYWITRMGHRLPATNPTQAAARTAALFFTATDEPSALGHLGHFGGPNVDYVMVDGTFGLQPLADGTSLKGKFAMMLTWAGLPAELFFETYGLAGPDGAVRSATVFYPDYYRTMAVRLSLYGGRRAEPRDSTWVISWRNARRPNGTPYKLIERSQQFGTFDEAARFVDENGPDRYRIVGARWDATCVPLEPLASFRELYASTADDTPDVAKIPDPRPVRILAVGPASP